MSSTPLKAKTDSSSFQVGPEYVFIHSGRVVTSRFVLYVCVCVVCLTGDLQAYAIRPVTTTAGLNAGVVVGTGTAQSLQVHF